MREVLFCCSFKGMLPSRKSLTVLAPVLALLSCIGIAQLARSQARGQDRWQEDSTPDSAQGRRVFTSKCASCHGLDGRGGERAPNIAGSAKLQRLSDADLSAIVSRGIPGTGMPAFRSLSALELHAVVNFVRGLQGQGNTGQGRTESVSGDPARGRIIFFGKGECSSCHMIQGEGGFLGPDLSTYGSARSAKEILEAITKPGKNADSSYRAAVAITRNGQRVSGLVRNEDNFSVQLQTAEGAFHFFQRSDLQSLEYQDRPLMPANYGERLAGGELNDLVSYLMRVSPNAKPDAPSQKRNHRRQD